jgi:TorA maturation chaperone TorD
VPKFCDELYKKSENDFYKGIGKLTKGFIISEKDVV